MNTVAALNLLAPAECAIYVRQRTDARAPVGDTPTMHQFPIPKRRSRGEPALQNFLSPRKSWIIVGVVCALSATGLLVGRMPAPIPTVGADHPVEPQANRDLDSHAPHRK
jgi:hypothetical protein